MVQQVPALNIGRARTRFALAAVFVCTWATVAAVSGAAPDAQALFDRGETFETFLKGVPAQRERWGAGAGGVGADAEDPYPDVSRARNRETERALRAGTGG